MKALSSSPSTTKKKGIWGWEVILDYPGKINSISRVLIRERQTTCSERRRCTTEVEIRVRDTFEDITLLVLSMVEES
jgi:hypothetical protein